MSYIAKDWNSYDYTNCDNQFAWAKEQNAVFRFHTLFWTNVQDYNNPSFIRESTDLARKEQFMTEYTSNVLSHYYDSAIYSIDVVNEIIDQDGNYRQD
jgi:GH35 family endo-1,4-beta-xylanase